jgi:hypothetical protein
MSIVQIVGHLHGAFCIATDVESRDHLIEELRQAGFESSWTVVTNPLSDSDYYRINTNGSEITIGHIIQVWP